MGGKRARFPVRLGNQRGKHKRVEVRFGRASACSWMPTDEWISPLFSLIMDIAGRLS
jgi:hypothetical protein